MARYTQKQVDAVLDIMRNPPFVCIGTEQGPYHYAVMENRKAPEIYDADISLDAMSTLFREKFEDKKTALFCRDVKNAEAIIKAIYDAEPRTK